MLPPRTGGWTRRGRTDAAAFAVIASRYKQSRRLSLSGWEYADLMSPIPGEPLVPKPPELTTSDGRKFKLKAPGLAPRPEPETTQERGRAETPRDDPRPPVDPDHAGA